jgi:photosystem II stability/assembly factor-like uncharacterized protein
MIWQLLQIALTLLMLMTDDRPGGFTVVGPGGGGAMFHPAVSPLDSSTVLVACDMTGSYISHDGGRSWRMFNLRGTVAFFVFDPLDRNVMYAKAAGLWRSQDNGDTWALIYPRPSALKGVKMSSDHADEELLANPDPLGTISAMAIDPRDAKTFYVTAGNRAAAKFGLFVTFDAGGTWQKSDELPGLASKLAVSPFSGGSDSTLVIAGADFIELKNSSGTRKVSIPPGPKLTDFSVGFREQGDPIFYAIADESAFVSRDLGLSWQPIRLGQSRIEARAIATSLRAPQVAFLSYRNLEENGLKYMGVAKTTDAGSTWTLVWKEEIAQTPKIAANIHDAWITERFGSDWGENPLALTVADQSPNLVYATDLGRTMRSTDGGANWTAVYSKKVDNRGWASTGLDVTTTYGYHVDPFNSKRRFITTTDIGLFRSEDGGISWVSSTTGVPKDWMNTTYWIVFDPEVQGRAWSVNSGTHDLPRPKMWRHTDTARYRGGVCISNDGGKTWTKSNDGLEQSATTHILLDPTSPVNSRTLYVTAFGRGVYKSSDGGRSWTLKNRGIREREPFAWRLLRDNHGTLYLLLVRRSEDGSIGTDKDGALYRSTDGAESWTAMALPAGANAPNGLAVDPRDTDRLYLAAWARDTGQHGDGGGIFLSEDSGKSWTQVLDRDRHVYDVTIDPRDPKILYAAGFESSAWRSTDRGYHWTRIPGFNFKWAHRVIPDPSNPDRAYITTFGGGVWYGQTNGPNLPVDIVTPELQPGRSDP